MDFANSKDTVGDNRNFSQKEGNSQTESSGNFDDQLLSQENECDDQDSYSSDSSHLIFHDVANNKDLNDAAEGDDMKDDIYQEGEHGQLLQGNRQLDGINRYGYGHNRAQGGKKDQQLLPIQFAKEHIIKIEEDMKKMHERHVNLMRDMDQNYRLIEKETQEYYIEFLGKWKEVAKQKILQYRKNTEALSQEKEKMENEKDQQIHTLNEQKTQLLKEKENLLKEINESISARDEELEYQKNQFEQKLKKKENEIYNLKTQKKQYEIQQTQLSAEYRSEIEQLKIQIQSTNQQNNSLQNQEEINLENIGKLQIELQVMQQENEALKLDLEKDKQENKDIKNNIKALLIERDQMIEGLENQMQERMFRTQRNSLTHALTVCSMTISNNNINMMQDQGQSSLQPRVTSAYQNSALILKFKQAQQNSSKIRFATGDQTSQNPNLIIEQLQQAPKPNQPQNLINQINLKSNQRALGDGSIKIKGIGLSSNIANKNLVLKSNSLQPQNQNGNIAFLAKANNKNLNSSSNQVSHQQMSEEEFRKQRDQISNDYQVKIGELQELIHHYNERIKGWQKNKQLITENSDFVVGHPVYFDQKIKQKLEQEDSSLKQILKDELEKLDKQYENQLNSKKQIHIRKVVHEVVKGSSNISFNSLSANEVNNLQGGGEANAEQLSLSRMKNVKQVQINSGGTQRQQENPYSSNKSQLDKSNEDRYCQNNDSFIMKNVTQKFRTEQQLDQKENAVSLSNKQYEQNGRTVSKQYVSLNSARDPASSRTSSLKVASFNEESKKTHDVKEFSDQIQKLDQENEQLRSEISQLYSEIKDKSGLEKELKLAKDSLMEVSQLYSKVQEKSRIESTTSLEQLQKEIDELKKNYTSKKAEYNKNIQFAKSKMDILKEQIEKLKQIVSQNRDEKTQYKSKITSLEQVNEKLKLQIDEVRQQTRQENTQLQNQHQEMREQNERLWLKYQTETVQRKRLHNIIEDMKGKIRVYCRVRPMNQNEIRMGCIDAVSIIDQFTLKIRVKKDGQVYKNNLSSIQQNQYAEKEFMYDACFGSKTNQEEIFEDTKMLIQSAIDGFNVCIFAYGQTGSGKTYTVTGTQDDAGIVPRAFQEMFSIQQKYQKDGHLKVKFECYMVELYMDKIIDLLTSGYKNAKQSSSMNQDKLDIREDSQTGMVYVQNTKMKELNSTQEALDTFNIGIKSRKTNSTEMNDTSSRSHLIFSIIIETVNNKTGDVTKSKLSFVDLAGSERLSKSNPNTNLERLRESNAINLSLKSLGDVIQSLSNGDVNKAYIPYRDNKLTHLMKDSLGGNSKTLMFVNISPADYNSMESQYSLQFGDRVKMVQNEVSKNIESEQLNKLRQENEILRKKLGNQ